MGVVTLVAVGGLLMACGPSGRSARGDGGEEEDQPDATMPLSTDLAVVQPGCGDVAGCYTVYAHSDHVLFRLDLTTQQLVEIGPFNAPNVTVGGKQVEDVITDLAVAPNDTIYVVSRTQLYTANAQNGHVTAVAPLANCGQFTVALTTTPDGNLYAADFDGAFCHVDLAKSPPQVTQIGSIGKDGQGNDLAIAGDIVAVGDGTMYGTAYRIEDGNQGTALNNLLVRIDTGTGAGTVVGQTGYAKMFGIAFAQGKVFGFTHDASGAVVMIDTTTGHGTLYKTFIDPTSDEDDPISFAGAGVNSKVSPIL